MSRYIIVAAVDYSELGGAALDAAIGLSSLHTNSEIHVIHVDPKLGAPKEELQIGDDAIAHSVAALDRLEEVCKAHLERYREERGQPQVARLSTHFRYGTPADEIVQLAADFNADVVVMGTHGHTGLKRLVLGSVAENVVRKAPCPVWVVRPKQRAEVAEVVDAIEPLCEDCHAVRSASNGATVWCARHAERRRISTHRYTYGYRNAGDGGSQSTRLGARG